jgi:hypothetical protein
MATGSATSLLLAEVSWLCSGLVFTPDTVAHVSQLYVCF